MDSKISSEEVALSPCEQMEHDSECPTCNYWFNESRICQNICEKCGPLSRNEKNSLLTHEKLLPSNVPSNNMSRIAECCSSITINEPEPTMNRSASLQSNLLKDDGLAECTFSKCGCNFKTLNLSKLNIYNQENIRKNMNLMLASIIQTKPKGNKCENAFQCSLNDESYQQNDISAEPNKCDGNLVKSLYDRISTLEQRSHDQEQKITQLTSQLNRLIDLKMFSSIVPNPQSCCGVLVWKISNFLEKKIDSMHNNPNVMFYSSDFYTAPFGYRFCARISMPPKAKEKDVVGLHVHMMQSDNDYHLDWPFRGCIKISMIHENSKFSLHDKIMTNEKSTAFQRPVSEISSHSFGFAEYASITNIRDNKFVSNDDILTIKIQISIV